jgi:curli biogenesis system outer membrane secretion channel CsgG
MKKLLLLCSVILIIGLAVYPTQGAEKYKIAVMPFEDGSIQDRWWNNDWKLGEGVSDELVTALMETGKFRLIEREQLDKVLEEQNFGTSGRVDAKTAAEIGKILGVRYLVMGRITEFTFKTSGGGALSFLKGGGLGIKTTTSRVTLDARMVDTTTAEILAGVKGKGEKKQTNLGIIYDWNAIAFGSDEFRKTDIGIALRDAVYEVADGLAKKAYINEEPEETSGIVAYVLGEKVYINLGASDGIKPGMVFVVYHILDLVKDPLTGEIIDEISEPIAEITVAEVKEKASTCIITTRLNSQYNIAIQDKVEPK